MSFLLHKNNDYILKNNLQKSLENVLYINKIWKTDRDFFIKLFFKQTPKNMLSLIDFQKILEKNVSKSFLKKCKNYMFVWKQFAALNWFFKENIVLYKYIEEFENMIKNDTEIIEMNRKLNNYI